MSGLARRTLPGRLAALALALPVSAPALAASAAAATAAAEPEAAGTALAAPAAPDPAAIARGAALVASRSQGLCVLCHALPGQPPTEQGTLGPPLAGVGARLSAAQLRERLLAPERFNPGTVMPAYGRSTGLQQVAAGRRGQPLLDAAQIDDVLAWLVSQR